MSTLLNIPEVTTGFHDSKSETSTEDQEFRERISAFQFQNHGSSLHHNETVNNFKIKNTLCKHFMKSGQCPYEGKCQFAHGTSELQTNRQSNRFYKTKPCLSFFEKTECTYGQGCNFSHVKPKKCHKPHVGFLIYQGFPEMVRDSGQKSSSRLMELLPHPEPQYTIKFTAIKY